MKQGNESVEQHEHETDELRTLEPGEAIERAWCWAGCYGTDASHSGADG